MGLSTREMRTAVDEVLSAMSSLDGESDGVRAAALERLLEQRLNGVADDHLGEPQPERINPWNGQAWTPEERCADLARRWETDAKHIAAIVNVDADEPWLRLPAAALSSDCDAAIRELALLLVSARVDSLFNTVVAQVVDLVVEYGLPAERVDPVLESMDRREILLSEGRAEGEVDIYLRPAGGEGVQRVVKQLTCHARG